MDIIAQCPKCRTRWLLGGGAADRRLTCPSCGELFKVPRLDELAKATEVLRGCKAPLYVDAEGRTYG